MTDQLTTVVAPTSMRQLVWQIGAATLNRFLFNTARRFPYPFAPALSRGLGVPLTDITSLIAMNLATGILSPLFGPLSDRWGYRVMMLASLGMLGLGMLAAGFLPFYGVIMVALFLAGLGKSIFDPALQAYLSKIVPYQRRGLVMGIIEFGWSGSSLLGLPLVGVLIDRVGWQSPFFVLGGLTFLAATLLAVLIPAEGRPVASAAPALSFGRAWAEIRGNRAALGLLAFSFLIGLANDNLYVVYGAWLEDAFALGIVALGATSSVIGLAELIGEGLTAGLADRLGLKRAIMVGFIVSTFSYLLLPLFGHTLPLALAGLFVVFLSFEFAVVTTISLATEVLPGARATMMASFMATMGVGRVIGALAGGSIWLGGGILAVSLVSASTTALALGCLWWGLHRWPQKSP
ncbi:MAG: MFS transporter [Anaerolineales bacterium]|nr:MFS transporter [Anaerolineales bacterium]